MADEQETAGTPEQDDRDAGESSTAGTPEPDGRDAQASSDVERLNLEWKAKAERVNELERSVEELRARLEQSPAASGKTSNDDDDESYWSGVEEFSGKGDPVARGTKKLRDKISQLEDKLERTINAVSNTMEARDITDVDERKAVEKHFLANRHRLGDIRAARNEILADKREREVEHLRAELAKYSKKPDPDVVRTEGREITAAQNKTRKMTVAEFDRLAAKLGATERMKLQGQLERDEIELT